MCPSVGASVRLCACPFVRPMLFSNNENVFEGKKSSYDMKINETMSDDEVVASYEPRRYLLFPLFIWFHLRIPCLHLLFSCHVFVFLSMFSAVVPSIPPFFYIIFVCTFPHFFSPAYHYLYLLSNILIYVAAFILAFFYVSLVLLDLFSVSRPFFLPNIRPPFIP